MGNDLTLLGCGGSGASDAFVGVLDNFDGSLSHAYSFTRRLLTSYEDPLVRIRRDSGEEQDFFARADGYLDVAAVLLFLDGEDGYVSIVYDQVGSADWSQATEANQPEFILSHDGFNGRSGAYFNVSDGIGFTPAINRPYSLSLIEDAVTGGLRTLGSKDYNAYICAGRFNGGPYFEGFVGPNTSYLEPVHEVVVAPTIGDLKFYRDGEDLTANSTPSIDFGRGAMGTSANYVGLTEDSRAVVADVLFFNTALSPAEVTTLNAVSDPTTL